MKNHHNPIWSKSAVRLYLRRLRGEMGLTLREVAEEAGYSTNALHAFEAGYRAPGFIQLAEWAEALGYRLTLIPIVPANCSQTVRERKKEDITAQRELE